MGDNERRRGALALDWVADVPSHGHRKLASVTTRRHPPACSALDSIPPMHRAPLIAYNTTAMAGK